MCSARNISSRYAFDPEGEVYGAGTTACFDHPYRPARFLDYDGTTVRAIVYVVLFLSFVSAGTSVNEADRVPEIR